MWIEGRKDYDTKACQTLACYVKNSKCTVLYYQQILLSSTWFRFHVKLVTLAQRRGIFGNRTGTANSRHHNPGWPTGDWLVNQKLTVPTSSVYHHHNYPQIVGGAGVCIGPQIVFEPAIQFRSMLGWFMSSSLLGIRLADSRLSKYKYIQKWSLLPTWKFVPYLSINRSCLLPWQLFTFVCIVFVVHTDQRVLEYSFHVRGTFYQIIYIWKLCHECCSR